MTRMTRYQSDLKNDFYKRSLVNLGCLLTSHSKKKKKPHICNTSALTHDYTIYIRDEEWDTAICADDTNTNQSKPHVSSTRVVAHHVKKIKLSTTDLSVFFLTVRHSSDEFIVTFEAFIANVPLPPRHVSSLDTETFWGGVQRGEPSCLLCGGILFTHIFSSSQEGDFLVYVNVRTMWKTAGDPMRAIK